jgi:predicted sulfurtransferase
MRFHILLVLALVTAATLLLACNSTERAPSNVSQKQTTSPSTTSQVPTVHADGIRRVTTIELKDLLAKNEAVVIDVRNEASFAVGHIRGAKLIPFTEVVKHANELPKDKLIVTYCS